jgi:hypothetical protein
MRILCEMLPAKLLLIRLRRDELPLKVQTNYRYNRARAIDILAQNVLGRRD